MHALRTPLLIVAAAAAFALAGCTSTTTSCDGGSCKISLSGENSSTTLGGEGASLVTLVKSDGKIASFKIGEEDFEASKGGKVRLDNGLITITEVGDNSMKLTLTQTTEESDAAAEEEAAAEEPAAEEDAAAEDPAAEEEVTEEPAQ